MQIQINCPYLRTSVYIENGVQNQVHVCSDQNCPIDPIAFCVGDKCRFVNISNVNNNETVTNEQKEELKEEVVV